MFYLAESMYFQRIALSQSCSLPLKQVELTIHTQICATLLLYYLATFSALWEICCSFSCYMHVHKLATNIFSLYFCTNALGTESSWNATADCITEPNKQTFCNFLDGDCFAPERLNYPPGIIRYQYSISS